MRTFILVYTLLFLLLSGNVQAQELQRGDLSAAIQGVEQELRALAEYDADRFDMDHIAEVGAVALMCPDPATDEVRALCNRLAVNQ